jgi:hypothetical protein
VDGNLCGGIAEARLSGQMAAGDAAVIEYAEPPAIRTVLKDPFGRTVAPGLTVQSQRVIVLPHGRFQGMPFSHLHPVRQELLQSVLLENVRGFNGLTFTLGAPYLPVYRFEMRKRTVLFFVNASLDDVALLRFAAVRGDFRRGKLIDSRTKTLRQIRLSESGGVWTVPGGLRALEAKALIFPGARSAP